MKIHKEGYKILRNQLLLFILINILIFYYLEFQYLYVSLIITVTIFGLSIYFFRIPKRIYTIKESAIYAPADGKIVSITKTQEDEYFKDERIQISIFMSPFNAHINRYPINGIVKYTKYHPGKYLLAWHPKSSTKNERNTIVIENNKIAILFRQIAGLVARRIVCYANTQTKINANDECGFIKFGSRVDIFLPIETNLYVKINDQVKGGKTILATY